MQKKVTKITTAVIPVAGRGSRLWPATRSIPKAMLPLPGGDGCLRPVAHHLILTAIGAGIERVCLVVDPVGRGVFEDYFSDACLDRADWQPQAEAARAELLRMREKVVFVEQARPLGLGHAVAQSRSVVAGGGMLVMLGDYVFGPDAGGCCPVAELLAGFERLSCRSLVGLDRVGPDRLAHCGVVRGEPAEERGLWRLEDIVEKPPLSFARNNLVCKGLAVDTYLAHFGLYAFDPCIFDLLDRLVARRGSGEVQLTDAQRLMLAAGGVNLGLELPGIALDLGGHDSYVAAWSRSTGL